MSSADRPAAVLDLVGLTKRIGRRVVVSEVSLSLRRGQVVGLFGPNGAGKTTTFYMIAGILSPDAGRILLDGHDITELSLSQRAASRINYLAQESSVFRHLSVRDNILAILEYRRDLSAWQMRNECDRLLREFNLNTISDSLGIRLSGGERRRTEIAMLLAARPRIVLMDEPFSGIDPISIKETKAIISRLRNQGISILLTDHNFRESLEICDYVYIFNNGRIVAGDRPERIVADPVVQKVYLGTWPDDTA